MFRSAPTAALIIATLLCVVADLGLTPFNSDGLISHRGRSTRSARYDSDHESPIPHEPYHGSAVQEIASAQGLVIQSVLVQSLFATAVEDAITFVPPPQASNVVPPLRISVPLLRTVAERPGRAPPAA